jgi:tmRNA-binding protein
LIAELNARYQKTGEYENTLRQIGTVETKLTELNKDLVAIDNELFSDEFELKIKSQINKFNKHFSAVSNELYGEKYALKVDTKVVKGRRIYEFTAFNLNFSSGKKQGEISCFDIAYTLFADEEGIPCMHFLLNDKKELMHGNQLMKIARLVNDKGIQFVASILKDKLPVELNKDDYVALKLSQEDKLFRIEG